jgi:LysM repeat protein
MNLKFLLLALVSISLSGCIMDQPPAPIDYGGTSSTSTSSSRGDVGEIIEKPIVHESVKWGNNPPQNVPHLEDEMISPTPTTKPDTSVPPTIESCAEATDHEVIEGETLDSLAKKYCVTKQAIIKANKLKAPFTLEELQILHIPQKDNEDLDVGDVITTTTSTPTTQHQQLNSLILPTQGTIVSKFGEIYNGAHNNGINIEASLGENIHSLSTGTVAFAGNDPKFGNLIIVKSKDSDVFMAYAHMTDLIFKEGDEIAKNQIVGHVGQTGNATSPQLHFAVRNGKTPIDPIKYLEKN